MGVEEALARRPWLLPFLLALRQGVEARAGPLAKALGVKGKLAKTALWELRRLGALEGAALKPEVAEWLSRQELAVRGRRLVWRRGGAYVLVAVKRGRISAFTVPADLVAKVEEHLKSVGGASAGDVAAALGCSLLAASRALQALAALGRASRDGRAYRYT